MKETIFKFGIVIIFLTYCIFVHNVVKRARYGIHDRKISDGLFITMLIEMIILALTQL